MVTNNKIDTKIKILFGGIKASFENIEKKISDNTIKMQEVLDKFKEINQNQMDQQKEIKAIYSHMDNYL